jgi:hypothetical protein
MGERDFETALSERRAPGKAPHREGAVKATQVGLEFPVRALDFHEWRRAGVRIARLANASAWYLGDWIAYGEAHYEDRYQRAVDVVGLSYQTLRNYAWVCRRFPLSRRRDTLTFYHHMEVAKLPAADQDQWLDRAQDSGWSVRALRKELKAHLDSETAGRASLPVVQKISAEAASVDRWRAAAARVDEDLADWIVGTLNAAATRALPQ